MDIAIALALGLLPGLVWLIFFLREDVHPEPAKMIAFTYVCGAMSALGALVLQLASERALGATVITLPRLFEDNISPFVAFAFIEECVKFIFVYAAVRKSKYFDEPIDAMIYMVTGALGFATVENVLLVFTARGTSEMFSIILLRFIGATLVHALGSGIIGHYWARGIKFRMEGKFVVAGVFLASVFHAVFNMLIVKFDDLLIYPTAFLMFAGFFVLYDFEDLKKIEEIAPEVPLPTPPAVPPRLAPLAQQALEALLARQAEERADSEAVGR